MGKRCALTWDNWDQSFPAWSTAYRDLECWELVLDVVANGHSTSLVNSLHFCVGYQLHCI